MAVAARRIIDRKDTQPEQKTVVTVLKAVRAEAAHAEEDLITEVIPNNNTR